MSVAAGESAVRWLACAEELLGAAAPHLDALNLFPVPDADTGSNLHATLRAAHRAAVAVDGDAGDVLGAAGSAALDSARGNSGTLMAVALEGMARPLLGHAHLTTSALAEAFAAGDRAARSALSEPREGTFLSVLTAAATSLAASAAAGDDPATASAGLVADARRAVEATEGQLAPLTRARVVDAGAVGLLWVLEALRAELTGSGVDERVAAALHGYADGAATSRSAGAAPIGGPHTSGDGAGVEVMCTVRLAPAAAADLRRRLEEVGDSVILAPTSRTPDADGAVPWRVHVHVPEAGTALDVVSGAGSPESVAVTDLSDPAHRHDASGPVEADPRDEAHGA